MIIFKLPFPPSVNALYSGNHRRFKSKRYTTWISEAEDTMRSNLPVGRLAGFVEVLYRLNAPDERRRDLGNSEKPISDFLVSWGVIDDDSKIQRLVMEWADDLTPGIVEVTVKSFP